MSLIRKKHNVLKHFYDQGLNLNEDDLPSDIIKKACLTKSQINKESGYEYSIIDSIIHTLYDDKLISVYKDEQRRYFAEDETTFLITMKGKRAFLEKLYINQIWYRTQKFWLAIIPIIISIVALIVSIVK